MGDFNSKCKAVWGYRSIALSGAAMELRLAGFSVTTIFPLCGVEFRGRVRRTLDIARKMLD